MHHADRNAHIDWAATPKNKLTIQKMPVKAKRTSLAPGLFLVLMLLSCGSAMGAF